MIGTRIRSFNHLIRLAKVAGEITFFYKHNFFNICQGVALYVSAEDVKNPYMPSKSDYLLIFNDTSSNVTFNHDAYNNTKLSAKFSEQIAKKPYLWVLPVDKKKFSDESVLFADKIYVPDDFEKKYAEFCDANKKQMPNATRFCGINSSILKYLFLISNGSKNFFFWAVNATYKQGISIYVLEKILNWNSKYSQLTKKLKKGTITGYTNKNDIFFLVLETIKLRREKRVNDAINMFNTAQKKALKEFKLTDRDFDTLSKFYKLSGKKKNNFIRKMSTINDPCEILKQMSFLADVHFEWKKESLLDFIKNAENFNCDIVIDRDNIVLLKVKDYETVKRLAKTTNWCISKDKKYWNQYVEGNNMATQYVLLDFSRKEDDNLSIVGFTSVHDRGITYAHDFQNKSLMREKEESALAEIKSFASKYIDSNSIYGVLDKYGIKLSDVVTYEHSQYEWNRESMFDYLNQCVEKEDYYIIADYGDRLALICDNENVKFFIGDNYVEQRLNKNVSGKQHIIFADFTKKTNDPDKIIFGIINHNFEEHESYCRRLFNSKFEAVSQSFDSKLKEFGLPYDIICRKDNVVERFYNSLSYYELATLKELINNKKVIYSLKSKERANVVKDYIHNVTFTYNSSDYIDLFYNNGLTLVNVIGVKYTIDITRNIIFHLYETAIHSFNKNAFVPSKNLLDDFNNNKINNYNEEYYVFNFLILFKILNNENNVEFFNKISACFYETHFACDLFDLAVTILCNKIDINSQCNAAKFIINYAYGLSANGRPRVINVINLKKKAEFIDELIKKFSTKTVKTTEMWVSRENGIYEIENIEEVAVHAPRLSN